MEILGIGPMELILILVIAMLVFGPDKLPEIGAKLGSSMRAMRRATRDFSREIEETRKAIEEPLQEIKQPLLEAAQPLQQVRDDLRNMAPLAQSITNPQEALRQAVTRELTQTGTTPGSAEAPAVRDEPAGVVSAEAPLVEPETAAAPDGEAPVAEAEPAAGDEHKVSASLAPEDTAASTHAVDAGASTETAIPPASNIEPVAAEGQVAPDPLPTEHAGTSKSAASEE